MIPPDTVDGGNVGLWGSLGIALGSAFTYVVSHLFNRLKRPAEEAASSAMEAASAAEASASKAGEFANVSIQRAITRLDDEVSKLHMTIKAQSEKIEEMQINEQIMASSLMQLEIYVDRLHDIMQTHNITPPPRPVTKGLWSMK